MKLFLQFCLSRSISKDYGMKWLLLNFPLFDIWLNSRLYHRRDFCHRQTAISGGHIISPPRVISCSFISQLEWLYKLLYRSMVNAIRYGKFWFSHSLFSLLSLTTNRDRARTSLLANNQHNTKYTHTHTHTHTRLTALCPGLPRWAGTRKVKPIWIYCSKRQWVAVASAGPYASLHHAPDR